MEEAVEAFLKDAILTGVKWEPGIAHEKENFGSIVNGEGGQSFIGMRGG